MMSFGSDNFVEEFDVVMMMVIFPASLENEIDQSNFAINEKKKKEVRWNDLIGWIQNIMRVNHGFPMESKAKYVGSYKARS